MRDIEQRRARERAQHELLSWRNREMFHLYYTKGWSIERLSRQYYMSQAVVRRTLEKMKRAWGRSADRIVRESEAVKQEQILTAITQCLARHRKTGDPAHIDAIAKLVAASKQELPAITQVGVSVNTTQIEQQNNLTQIEVDEDEGWYGEHGTRAHQKQLPSTVSQALTAHAQGSQEPGQVQSSLQRPAVGEDGDQHADAAEGSRSDTGLSQGSDLRGEAEVPVDGSHVQANPTLDLEGSGECNQADLLAD